MQTRELLDAGVERGIISADQRSALQALQGDVASTEPPREAERGFNGIAIAYALGAIVVLFAFGWFMVDRWTVLGGRGLLLLALGYAGIFLVVAHTMKREGFVFARGVAMLLAVGMAPIAMYALLQWTGAWTPALDAACRDPEHSLMLCQGRPMAVELAAVAAALVAMRTLPFSPFMIPIAVVLVTLPGRLLEEWGPSVPFSDGAVGGWRWVTIASLLAAVAYTMDRRRRGEDYAFWLWIAVAVCTWFGCMLLFQFDRSLRWYLAPASLLIITASVILRRRALLVVGLFGVFGFLGWLAFDVFKVTTAFPLVLAMIGVAIIVLTVWVQKRFPDLIQRMGGDPTSPVRFPGGVPALLAPALLGVLLMQDAARLDREVAADRRSRAHATASRTPERRRGNQPSSEAARVEAQRQLSDSTAARPK